MSNKRDHQPIQDKFHALMNALAEGIDKIFNGDTKPKKIGWVLLSFEFGKVEGGRVNYISNAERSEMLLAMKEYIARAEGRYVEADEGPAS